jgi:hypothetical protein
MPKQEVPWEKLEILHGGVPEYKQPGKPVVHMQKINLWLVQLSLYRNHCRSKLLE